MPLAYTEIRALRPGDKPTSTETVATCCSLSVLMEASSGEWSIAMAASSNSGSVRVRVIHLLKPLRTGTSQESRWPEISAHCQKQDIVTEAAAETNRFTASVGEFLEKDPRKGKSEAKQGKKRRLIRFT